MRVFVRWLMISIWIGGLGYLIHGSSQDARDWAVKAWRLVEEPPFTGLSPAFVDVFSLGHKSVVDDALLFHTLNYLTEPGIKATPPEDVLAALRATGRLQPKIETIYMFGCLVLALDMDAPHLCEPVILDGIGLFPDGWRLPVTLGTILYAKLKDDAKAAIFYEMAVGKPYAPPFTRTFALKLRNRSQPDPTEVDAIIKSLRGVAGLMDEGQIKEFYDGAPPVNSGAKDVVKDGAKDADRDGDGGSKL